MFQCPCMCTASSATVFQQLFQWGCYCSALSKIAKLLSLGYQVAWAQEGQGVTVGSPCAVPMGREGFDNNSYGLCSILVRDQHHRCLHPMIGCCVEEQNSLGVVEPRKPGAADYLDGCIVNGEGCVAVQQPNVCFKLSQICWSVHGDIGKEGCLDGWLPVI